MKKLLFLTLILISFVFYSNAQNLPNNGFETWTNATTPASWSTNYSGMLSGAIPLTFSFGTRTLESHSGTYALKISPNLISLGSVTLPAFVQLGSVGTFNIDAATLAALIGMDFTNIDLDQIEALQSLISKGTPISDSPSEVKFWFKFLPDGTDQAIVNVITTKWNPSLGVPDVIATGVTTISDLTTQYTAMNVPMTLEGTSSICDTIRVIFSVAGSPSSAASEFFIDDISLKFNSWGIENAVTSTVKLFPNPTQDVVTVSLTDQTNPCQMEIYDSFGKLVLNIENVTDQFTFSTADYSSGIYMVKIVQNGTSTTSKLMVE